MELLGTTNNDKSTVDNELKISDNRSKYPEKVISMKITSKKKKNTS